MTQTTQLAPSGQLTGRSEVARSGTTRRRLIGFSVAGGAAVVGSAFLAACGTATSKPAEPAGTRKIAGPQTLSYTTFNDISTPEYKECNQVFSERFGGNIQIEAISVPANEYIVKMTALMVSNSLTDVVQGQIASFPALAKIGLYKPITSFLNKDKAMTPKDFFSGHVQAFTWKGELMGLTGGLVDQNVLFVNKRTFEANGVKVPTPQESQTFTWDRVVDLAKRLTKSDGSQWGLFINTFAAVPFSAGAYWVNDRANATRGAFDDPRWQRTLDSWLDWTQKQRVMPQPSDLSKLGEQTWTDAFARGKVAMYLHQSPQIRFALQAEPSLQWDMIWVPKMANDLPRKFFSSGAGWGMTPQARNTDLSWEWVKFIDRKPGSYEISLKHNPAQAIYLSSHIPTTQKELERLKKMGVTNADLLVAGANDLYWPPLHTEWPRIDSTIVTPDLTKMQRGEVPVAGALKDLNERVTRELATG
jgi:ABC-type glycerol-3-phosphate transport system substrate-binding protein